MPGSFTDYANDQVLDLFFGATPVKPVTTLYVGLSRGTANKFGAYEEPQGAGYQRVPVPNTPSSWPAAERGTKANAGPIAFPKPTGDWGTVVSLFVADSPLEGNVLAMADVVTPRSVQAGGFGPTVAPGALFLSHT